MINENINWYELHNTFINAKPFNHVVIDNFFQNDIAAQLAEDIRKQDVYSWHYYKNALENKFTCNDWNKFPPVTYNVFSNLNSESFIRRLSTLVGIETNLYPDVGLHGGGWHCHANGGKLNVHLDYNIHPKLLRQRKLNLIIYMTPDWNPEWGGGLGLWTHDAENNQPGECVATVENKFNRAVLFDTTQNSWHGLPDPINCPEDIMRRSLAVYYLTDGGEKAEKRYRALFAPTSAQKNDATILEFIKQRSNTVAS